MKWMEWVVIPASNRDDGDGVWSLAGGCYRMCSVLDIQVEVEGVTWYGVVRFYTPATLEIHIKTRCCTVHSGFGEHHICETIEPTAQILSQNEVHDTDIVRYGRTSFVNRFVCVKQRTAFQSFIYK